MVTASSVTRLERGRFQGVGPLGAVHAVMCSSRRLSILQPTPLPANIFRARSLADCCIGRRSQVSIGNIFNTPKPNPRTHPAGVSRISSTACAYDACMKASLRFPPLQLYKLPGRGQLPEKTKTKTKSGYQGDSTVSHTGPATSPQHGVCYLQSRSHDLSRTAVTSCHHLGSLLRHAEPYAAGFDIYIYASNSTSQCTP